MPVDQRADEEDEGRLEETRRNEPEPVRATDPTADLAGRADRDEKRKERQDRVDDARVVQQARGGEREKDRVARLVRDEDAKVGAATRG